MRHEQSRGLPHFQVRDDYSDKGAVVLTASNLNLVRLVHDK